MVGRVRVLQVLAMTALAVPTAAGCDPRPVEGLDWSVAWSDGATERASEAIRYEVVAGACGSEAAPAHRSDWVDRNADPAALPSVALDPGAYCFCVEAQDARCRRIARVCDDVELPRGAPLTLTLTPTTPEPLGCDCHAAHCGDAGAADGGSMDGGLFDGGPDASPPDGVEHVIEPASEAPIIDGDCEDFADATPVVFGGARTSDNETDCRFKYAPGPGGGDRAKLFACCVVEDSDIRGDPTLERDDPSNAWLGHDRVEVWIRPGPEAVFDDDYLKVALTAAGTLVDAGYDEETFSVDSSYFTIVVHEETVVGDVDPAVVDGDTSYVLEYSANLPESAAVSPGDVGRMNVFMADSDEGGDTATMADGDPGSINEPGTGLRIWFAP